MRVLLVEDEEDLARQLQESLVDAGYAVDVAHDGEEGHYLGAHETYDAVVLDLGLPVMDGITVLERWRRDGLATPVLILTARDRWSEKVAGFDAGADDYVAKPFHMEEVLARLRALVRRAAGHASAEMSCGPVHLDTRSAKVSVEGQPIKLTAQEYRLLAYLMHHQDKIVSRTELTEHLYDQDFDRDSNTIEVFVGRLRKKLGVDVIQTARGLGYRLAPPGAPPIKSLASRLVVSAAIWCALLLSASGFALSALFGDAVRNSFDARLAVLLEGVVAGTSVGENGRLDLSLQLGEPRFDQPFSGWYWQISDDEQPVRRSSSLWAQALVLPRPEGEEVVLAEVPGPSGQTLRVLIRPILLPGQNEPYWYAVAGDESELRGPKNRFDRLLALTLAMLFGGVLAAILIQVRFGLQPLFRIQRALSAIRSGESRRLEGAYPSEIQPLARELNALIDHSETLIERAQTHVGNLAHGLKTPLSVLANEVREKQTPFSDLVDRQTTLMRQQVEHHLARARAAATSNILGARSDVAPVLEDLRRTLERIHGERGIEIAVTCPEGLVFRGARHDLEEMLGNLMDNACKWAKSRVGVVAERRDDTIFLTIDDDGDGLPPSKRDEVLKRGRRLDESVPGTGLGLSIVVDLASLYGGRFELGDADLGGLSARLHLPAGESVRAKTRT